MQNLNKTGTIISNCPKFLNILQSYGDFYEIKVFTELAAFFPHKDTTNYLILQYCNKILIIPETSQKVSTNLLT